MLLTAIGGMLLDKGLDYLQDLISDKGEDLINEGVKKVTGIDLKASKELTAEQVQELKDKSLEIQKLDYAKLKLELETKKENNRHLEAIFDDELLELGDNHRHTEKLREQAHETYREKSTLADSVANKVFTQNLPIMLFLVILQLVATFYLKDNTGLLAITSNLIGIALANLFNERQVVLNFLFGSSIGSKIKSKMLEQKS